MNNLAIDNLATQFADDFTAHFEEPGYGDSDIVEFRLGQDMNESLHENTINEIDAWARQALASNGFGDY